MPSSAISAQQSALRVRTGTGTAINITSVTKANPPVVTATGHGLADGSVVLISGVSDMPEINDRVFITASSGANSFALRGIDGSGYTAEGTGNGTGGTVRQQTMTKVGNVKTFNIAQDEAPDIAVTNLDSIRQEFRVGLAGSWTLAADVDIDPSDAGQAALSAAQDAGAARAFTLTLQNGKVFAGLGYVKSLSAQGSADSVVSGSLNVRGTNAPTFFV